MIEKGFLYDWQPHILALGKPSGALKLYNFQQSLLQASHCGSLQGIVSHSPIAMACQGGVLSIIDQRGCLWIAGSVFYEPVNVSDLIRMKAKKVYLGEGQLLFKNKKGGLVLVTWTTKSQFQTDKLRKIAIGNGQWSHLFQAYFVEQETDESSLWYYSTVKKLDNTVKLYHLNPFEGQIVGLPIGKKMMIPSPAGMSLGKYHGLVWTEDGRIFGWGCKNLGLGLRHYDRSFYDELQQINLPESIIKAHAGINYSMALTTSGLIYQWGIDWKGEIILTPRILCMNGLRFVDIKGNLNIFGGLTSKNQLYVWGKNLQSFFGETLEKTQLPVCIKKSNGVKIKQFQIDQNCIIIVVDADSGLLSCEEVQYFKEVVNKVSTKWLPNRIKSKAASIKKIKEYRSAVCTPDLVRKNEDYIDKLVGDQMNKENYFNQIQNQQDLFRKLMVESIPKAINRLDNNYFIAQNREQIPTQKKHKKTHKKMESARDNLNVMIDLENTTKFIKQFEKNHKQSKSLVERNRLNMNKQKANVYKNQKILISPLSTPQKRSIIINLQSLQLIEQTIKSGALSIEKSFSIRKTVRQSQRLSNSRKEMNVISLSFKKIYLSKMILDLLATGRQLKLKQIKQRMHLNMMILNFKKNNKHRNPYFLKALEVEDPPKYKRVINVIKNAIRKWRLKKLKQCQKQVLKVIICKNLYSKIHERVRKLQLQTHKIHQVAKWLKNQQRDRITHLRCLWKKWLLLSIKPSPSFENKRPSACREELNFKMPADKAKPIRLSAFIQQSQKSKPGLPVSKTGLKLQNEKKEDNYSEMINDLSIKKGVSWAERKRLDTLETNARETTHKSNHSQGIIDILPYSVHYDSFFKPKNYQINIPDNMKHSEKWIVEQKKILDKILRDQLHLQWTDFWTKRKNYEFQLSLFLRDNYDRLAQYRWKFIFQYNKIQNEPQKVICKKQQQILRLLRQVGAQSLLMNDVIPQRHKILEYTKQLKGGPVAPRLQTKLTQPQFKKLFKAYYELTSFRSKQMRKFFN